jgi:hypothetical protein
MRVNMEDVFVFICESRRMKPVETVLRRGRRERKEIDGGSI